MPVACWCSSRGQPDRQPLATPAPCGAQAPLRSGHFMPPMATFLWTLEWGGVTIALLGLGRERWLAGRRR